MIIISLPQTLDAEGINEVIKLSWYSTYVTPEIGVTKKDVDLIYAKSEEGQLKTLRERALNPKDDDISLVAKEENKVVGYIRFKIFPTEIELRTLYVHPSNTGKGIGTKLWEESFKILPKGKIIFTEPVEHTKSVEFYKKIGFTDTGERYLAPEAMEDSGTHLPLIKMTYSKLEKDNRWEEYVAQTKDIKPRPFLVKAVEFVKEKNEAVDLGSGALNDVRYLVSKGFKHVTALDSKPVAKDIIKNFPADFVTYVINSFEEFEFAESKYDLISAQYALPFNPKESFNRVIGSIIKSLIPGGVFTGQFFGDRDEWNTPESKMTFVTKEQAQHLLKDLKVVLFTEEDKEGNTAAGKMKHWHVFHFITTK